VRAIGASRPIRGSRRGFDALARAYSLPVRPVRGTLAAAPLDARTKAQWGFVLRQAIDALSPANALLTNPEAAANRSRIRRRELAQGMRLFVEDRQGRVSMTEDRRSRSAACGDDPRERRVSRTELMQMLQYAPTTTQVYTRPLAHRAAVHQQNLILDLQPDNSFVATGCAGPTVFLVSWRNIDRAGPAPLDDYLEQGVMRASTWPSRSSRADRINTLGFCVGARCWRAPCGETAEARDKSQA